MERTPDRRNNSIRLGVLFFSPESPECSTSETLYESRLDKGLTTTEEHSYFLMNSAREDTAKARDLLSTAKKYSPDLPAVYFAFAGETLSPSADGLFLGLDYFRQGINAYGKNFWWKFSMAGLVYISLLVFFVVSALVTVLIRLPLDAGLLNHDGLEQRNRLLLLGVPALLSFFGPVGFTAGAVLVLGLYFRKEHTAVVYAVLLFFLFSPMLRYVVDVLLSKPPALKAVVNVNEGRENRYALTVLKDMKDFTSSYILCPGAQEGGRFWAGHRDTQTTCPSDTRIDFAALRQSRVVIDEYGDAHREGFIATVQDGRMIRVRELSEDARACRSIESS